MNSDVESEIEPKGTFSLVDTDCLEELSSEDNLVESVASTTLAESLKDKENGVYQSKTKPILIKEILPLQGDKRPGPLQLSPMERTKQFPGERRGEASSSRPTL